MKWRLFKCLCGYSWKRPMGFPGVELCGLCKTNDVVGEVEDG